MLKYHFCSPQMFCCHNALLPVLKYTIHSSNLWYTMLQYKACITLFGLNTCESFNKNNLCSKKNTFKHMTKYYGKLLSIVDLWLVQTLVLAIIETVYVLIWDMFNYILYRGHGGRVVTLSPPTSETGVQFQAWPQVGKLVVASHWSAVYSTEP